MALLRVASLVVVSMWTGGLAVLGFVAAPEIFATLEAAEPTNGRVLAGQVFGAVFARFQHWAWILGAILIGLFIARALLGPRPRKLGLRLLVVAVMISLGAATAYAITPRIDTIRTETRGSIASLPDSDSRKAEFGRLHALSSIFMLITLAGGVGLLWAESHDSH
jgi:uncharacterized membrane protein